jgi:hypothetical protein
MISERNKKIFGRILLVINIVYFIVAPNIFQKGGVNKLHFLFLFFLIFLMSLFFFIRVPNQNKSSKQIISLIIVCLISYLIAFLLTYGFVQLVYRDKTWFLWENPHKILVNMVLFLLILISVFIFTKISFKLK